jgi:hypothetical protein
MASFTIVFAFFIQLDENTLNILLVEISIFNLLL